ncbi:DUF3017 domain-containing protein [Streptomyces subrutilus]|uniref:DUF3017 domain-containing protein n=1 Tax=Streptomyces subrutilus TaxID=36818 RepID=A0A5P2UIU6_9ACTN|nr:DUF3017 domain-containing protein [Streptomyces subrutilus]QEU79183.1 DUF3017 domain-containing protein [Streptomyces subrutilus]WSJ31628.1 DUF3017 domain-containing protein [Streptomyces subrutilus]GGZ52515.1 hypothetical protein GCM10010371_09960 [Streptomyces subrutilus]
MRADPGAEPAGGRPAGAAGEGAAGAGAAEGAAGSVPGSAAGSASGDPAGAEAAEPARSRRFPSVTRDTARPEGSGRAVPGAVSAPARQWPMLSVLAATAAGLLVTALGHPRIGCLVIGAALIAASAMRRMLPSVGMLAVRSRFTDMVTYGLLGVAITLLALVMEPEPLLEIPFLETVVRFTVR